MLAQSRTASRTATCLRRAVLLTASLGLLALSGCVAYDPYGYGYYPAPAYYAPAPVVVGGGWGWGGGWRGGGGWHGGWR